QPGQRGGRTPPRAGGRRGGCGGTLTTGEAAVMRATDELPRTAEPWAEFTAVCRNWLVFVLLGAALGVGGVIALGSLAVASLATAVAVGALLLAGGVAETLSAFWSRSWSGSFLHLLPGLLSVVLAVFFLGAPIDALLALTLLLACLLMA